MTTALSLSGPSTTTGLTIPLGVRSGIGNATITIGAVEAVASRRCAPPSVVVVDTSGVQRLTNQQRGRIDLAEHFAALVEWWRESTEYLSSPSERAGHIAYQKIVELGPRAIPLILRELQQNGGSGWYIALRRLTGASPVPPEAAANSKRVRELWIQWGTEHGFV